MGDENKNFALNLNKFSFNFNDAVSTNHKAGNIVSSPFSVFTTLAMLGVGANNATKRQILQAMGLKDDNITPLVERMGELYQNLTSDSTSTTLSVANNIWMDQRTTVLERFHGDVSKHFGVDIGRTDFNNNAESARKTINRWVEQRTSEKITELFSSGSIASTTELVLANAVYFKGAWKEQFDAQDTSQFDFFLDQEESVKVDFMFRHDKMATGYDPTYNLQLLKLPHAGTHTFC